MISNVIPHMNLDIQSNIISRNNFKNDYSNDFKQDFTNEFTKCFKADSKHVFQNDVNNIPNPKSNIIILRNVRLPIFLKLPIEIDLLTV